MLASGVFIAPLLALVGIGDQPQASSRTMLRTPQPVVRRVIVRDQLILRVPVRPRSTQQVRFEMSEGPRCFDSNKIAGARIAGSRSIDFIMTDKTLMRVDMDRSCTGLDFYSGFYVRPDDDKLCARRDVIRTRMGGQCRIENFQRLRPIPND